MIDTLLTLGVLAVLALLAGGVHLWNRDRRRAVLMLVAGLVIMANIALWTVVPTTPPPPPPNAATAR